MEHHASHVGRGAECRIADDIQVGESGNTERVAEPVATRTFDVGQDLQIWRDLEPCVQCEDARGGVLASGLKAVGTAVRRRKIAVLLANKICLARDPEPVPKIRAVFCVLNRRIAALRR